MTATVGSANLAGPSEDHMADALTQYLERHARPEAAPLAEALMGAGRSWRRVLIVPALAESIELFAGIEPAARDRGALAILVVNHARGAAPEIAAKNRELLEAAKELGSSRQLDETAQLIETPSFDLVAIDRASPGRELPAGEGVGLARRIGFDLALALRRRGALESRWIHTTDADAVLPAAYFEAADRAPAGAVALTYPYWHQCAAPARSAAVALYEISLRYWVLGLRAAGSRHAFSAVGSTLAVEALAYARVRGVPLRQAGEDFHLLAKLAKLGPIARPRCPPIALDGDRSPRTPFGTARSVAAIAERPEAFSLYHHRSFALLGELIDALADERPLADPDLERCARAVGLERMRRAAARERDRRGRRRVAEQWLDGLRTVRLVHRLRDEVLGTEPWREALARAPFVPAFSRAADVELDAARATLRDAEDRALQGDPAEPG